MLDGIVGVHLRVKNIKKGQFFVYLANGESN